MPHFHTIVRLLPLAATLVLASCGGGGAQLGTQSQQQPGVAVGEPSPSIVVDSAAFLAAARIEPCADLGNRLFVIDAKTVYWERKGNCPDNGSAQRLFGNTLDKLVCSQVDTIAGPRQQCADDAARAMFDTILKNSDKADLGLGSGHQVEQLKIPAAGSTVSKVAFETLEPRVRSLVAKEANHVVRERAAWESLWRSHAGDAALPEVDFSRKMVIAVFLGTKPDGCHSTDITSIIRFDGKLLVTHADTVPGPAVLCTAALVQPAHLVVTDRIDSEVSFLSQVVVLQ